MFDELFQIIEDRRREKPCGSYTAQLMEVGENQILRKIGEETLEVIFAAKDEGELRVVEESADLIYHLWVLLSFKGITLEQVKKELSSRHKGEK